MPRVTFVKKAKRPVPSAGIEVGDSYYWWAFRTAYSSRKCFSKTPPKPSQLTQSDFRSQLLAIGEDIPSFSSVEDVESWVEDAKSQLEDLKSETEDKLQNMPESLQQSPTGELLQERIDGCDNLISELDNLNFDVEEVDPEDIEKPEDPAELETFNLDEAVAQANQEKEEEKLSELEDEINSLDWSFG